MRKKISVKKIWIDTIELMVQKPIVLLPFFIIAFIEGMALELICFFPKRPLSIIMGPLIRKFFGEPFMHYPFFLAKIPKLFYVTQIVIYVAVGVLLSAITVNIVKNLRGNLPIKANALIKNGLKRYVALISFGAFIMIVITLMRKGDNWLIGKMASLILNLMPNIRPHIIAAMSGILYFITNLIIHVFFILTVPIIVIKKRLFLGALWESVVTGFKNFFGILIMIGLPYLLYLPISVLKSFSVDLGAKAVPEVVVVFIGIGIIIAAFMDCFITVCVTQFLLEKGNSK